MALRFVSEQQFNEWLQSRKMAQAKAAPIRAASPSCCQPARPSGVSLTQMDQAEERPKRNKYGNRRVELDGMKFDSEHEARVYQDLMIRVRAGELKCVCRQVPFDLPGGIRYFADFVTIAPDMRIEVLDAKSEATKKNAVYIIKKKQVQAIWGITIKEV